ncbi:MAG: hypothetical protein LBD02_10655 [Christensenellaceae bacterium]|jgi:type IV secretory pathway TrbD component|nr:hypothetical protein [Christensenellaceae bacterium]
MSDLSVLFGIAVYIIGLVTLGIWAIKLMIAAMNSVATAIEDARVRAGAMRDIKKALYGTGRK